MAAENGEDCEMAAAVGDAGTRNLSAREREGCRSLDKETLRSLTTSAMIFLEACSREEDEGRPRGRSEDWNGELFMD